MRGKFFDRDAGANFKYPKKDDSKNQTQKIEQLKIDAQKKALGIYDF